MPRKPAHLAARGKLTPRERIWAAIREMKRFTTFALARRLHIHDKTVESYVTGLHLAGYLALSKIDPARFNPTLQDTYELRRDCGIDAPRLDSAGREVTQGSGTLALWRTMKIHRKSAFSAAELAEFASTDTHRVAPNTAKTYCMYLERAGYLRIDRPAKPGTPALYRLVKHTGPKAPQIQRVKHVYDPNLGEVVWHPAEAQVSA